MTGRLNIVVPMAGAGSRFADAGFELPKPLIPVRGVPMIKLVIANLTPSSPHRFIFVVQKRHVEQHHIDELLAEWAPGCDVVVIGGITDGAARTVLAARELIDSRDPLMIANSDQYVSVEIDEYLARLSRADGLIMTMTADNPKWSYVKLHDARVTEVVEKVVVSDQATVGIYNFARGSDFVAGADRMIAAGRMANGEYYVAPVYNELIDDAAEILTFNVGADGDGMYGLGIPADLEAFLTDPASEKALAPWR